MMDYCPSGGNRNPWIEHKVKRQGYKTRGVLVTQPHDLRSPGSESSLVEVEQYG